MSRLNVILFLAALVTGAVAFLASPKYTRSVEEKRKLAELKPFNWDTYRNKVFSKSTRKYVEDHFPFRKEQLDGTDELLALKGLTLENQERIILADVKQPKEDPGEPLDPTISHVEYTEDFEEAYTGNLLILNGKVYNLTGGSTKMSPVFARMVSEYAKELQGECTVYSAVAPVSCAFIPVEKYRRYNTQNRNTLAAIGAHLTNGAKFADIFTELNNHSGQQLYFGTDHHWNATGAYYAYVAYCKAAGLTPVPLENMDKRVKYGFLGTMYQQTRDKSVKDHPDTFQYYIPRVTTTAIRYPEYGFGNPMKVSVFANSNGGNMYSTFISGDHPLIKITTSTKNGRKCAVVKNSMGNAFSVYLISHYEEIYVVDLRYSKHNLISLIRENHINDLVFAVGLYAAMSNGTIGMMRRLATHSGAAPPKPQPADTLDTQPAPAAADTLKGK